MDDFCRVVIPFTLPKMNMTMEHHHFYRIGDTSSNGCFSVVMLPSLKLTAKAPENGWLEYDRFAVLQL